MAGTDGPSSLTSLGSIREGLGRRYVFGTVGGIGAAET